MIKNGREIKFVKNHNGSSFVISNKDRGEPSEYANGECSLDSRLNKM
jgi:hypothetical protein